MFFMVPTIEGELVWARYNLPRKSCRTVGASNVFKAIPMYSVLHVNHISTSLMCVCPELVPIGALEAVGGPSGRDHCCLWIRMKGP